MNSKRATILVFLSGFAVSMLAQPISRNVVVVKPYEPSLSDAHKISALPRFDDTVAVMPPVEYTILPVKLDVPFELKPVSPARMVGTPLEKLYNSYIKLGLGNYFTPVAEYSYNSTRSKEKMYGIWFSHKSSGRKITLDNKDRVPAGYSQNRLNLFGTRFFNQASLNGNIRLAENGAHFYGYNTALFTDSFPDIRGRDTRHKFYHAGATIGVQTTHTDSSKINFRFMGDAGYTADRFGNNQWHLLANTGMNKKWGNTVFGTDLSIDYLKPSLSPDTTTLTLIGFTPWFGRKTAEYEFLVGGRFFAALGSSNRYYVYPRAYLQFNVIDNIILPYVGIDGRYGLNTLWSVANENPYLKPGTMAGHDNSIYIYAGVKGLVSARSGFNTSVSYHIVNHMPFFVNDSTGPWDNHFTIVYDSLELTRFNGEIYYDPFDFLHLKLYGNIDFYSLGNEPKPWHKPSFDLTFSVKYIYREKVITRFDLLATGTRWARPFNSVEGAIRLKPILDLNVGLEYRYTKILSFFLQFHNLTGGHYEYWNHYPVQKFNFIAGFSYKL